MHRGEIARSPQRAYSSDAFFIYARSGSSRHRSAAKGTPRPASYASRGSIHSASSRTTQTLHCHDCGIDLHASTLGACIPDPTGETFLGRPLPAYRAPTPRRNRFAPRPSKQKGLCRLCFSAQRGEVERSSSASEAARHARAARRRRPRSGPRRTARRPARTRQRTPAPAAPARPWRSTPVRGRPRSRD